MILYYDVLVKDGIGYPNLATPNVAAWSPEWYTFDHRWPRVIPLRLLLYHQSFITKSTQQIDCPGWYPVGIGWFDHDLDYFDLMSSKVIDALRSRQLRVLFYYHEGDNPARIKLKLDMLVHRHQLPINCYHFVSANTSADSLDNFSYFPDHEYFFRYCNQQSACGPGQEPVMDFSAVNRLPKWWRASCMADLWRLGVLDNSLWSYNTASIDISESPLDNPIELDSRPGWRCSVEEFLKHTPRFCDDLSGHQHNQHREINLDIFHQTRFHIVFETFLDADQSGGAFLTEKTFKPIKFGQPFVVVGTSGSLQALRNLGYRTFDDVIDPTYDTIADNTARWNHVREILLALKSRSDIYRLCLSDCDHNQNLFCSGNPRPLNTLLELLT